MPKKLKENEGLTYRGKPLVQMGDEIYYGNQTDKYIVRLATEEASEVNGVRVSKRVTVELRRSDPTVKPKDRVVKKAEREGLYKAMDVGMFWLDDALKRG